MSRRRFDSVEVLAIVGFVAVSAALFSPTRRTEVRVVTSAITSEGVQRLADAYGPNKYSMGPEEWILREILQDQREGVFLDVGASDARVLSNTYYLESVLGWSGIAIDAQPEYAGDYARYRPKTRFRSFFISDRSDETLPFYVAGQRGASSANPEWAGEYTPDGIVRTITVPTITLDDLLARENVSHVDLLTMDIEGHEPNALAGFSIERFRPRVVVVEAHSAVRQRLLDYFTAHRYVLLARYLGVDDFNWYFTPLATRQ